MDTLNLLSLVWLVSRLAQLPFSAYFTHSDLYKSSPIIGLPMREQSKYRSFCSIFYTKSFSIDTKALLP
jgi:hypothetical protein